MQGGTEEIRFSVSFGKGKNLLFVPNALAGFDFIVAPLTETDPSGVIPGPAQILSSPSS